MKIVPKSHEDLLSDEKKAFAFLGTKFSNGKVQVTPVWFNTSGGYFLVNTAKDRVKARNMNARPDVTLCISDPDNPYRYLQVRGRVVDSTEEGANDHIDALSMKYTGNPKYQNYRPGMVRVIYKIQPEKVDPHG